MSNIDHATGIRYGVIPAHDLGQPWYEGSEADYGPASCGECGNEAIEIGEVPFDLDDCEVAKEPQRKPIHFYRDRPDDHLVIPAEFREECGDHEEWLDDGRDYACLNCARSFESDDAYGEEALGFNLDDGEYVATQGGDDCDIFVIKSPYYTYGPYCSPCAPGAVYIRNGGEGQKAYCFAPDWFWDACYDPDRVTGEYDGEKTACPYPVFRVADDVCIFVPNQAAE